MSREGDRWGCREMWETPKKDILGICPSHLMCDKVKSGSGSVALPKQSSDGGGGHFCYTSTVLDRIYTSVHQSQVNVL